jgi:hypothetical protein
MAGKHAEAFSGWPLMRTKPMCSATAELQSGPPAALGDGVWIEAG